MTMKAWVCEKPGLDNFKFKKDVPVPMISENILKEDLEAPFGDGHAILVKNLYGAVNPVDWKMINEPERLLVKKWPTFVGLDSVAIVQKIGPKVDKEKFIPGKTHVVLY